jgi:hypothetical protein
LIGLLVEPRLDAQSVPFVTFAHAGKLGVQDSVGNVDFAEDFGKVGAFFERLCHGDSSAVSPNNSLKRSLRSCSGSVTFIGRGGVI